jgi:hypothetical protein
MSCDYEETPEVYALVERILNWDTQDVYELKQMLDELQTLLPEEVYWQDLKAEPLNDAKAFIDDAIEFQRRGADPLAVDVHDRWLVENIDWKPRPYQDPYFVPQCSFLVVARTDMENRTTSF